MCSARRQLPKFPWAKGSLLHLRASFGLGIHTALARIEGRPVGLLANNPQHLGGAIEANAADKAARFLQLCNAHGLPVSAWWDTPGFMVGPDTEATAQVRHASRLFVVSPKLRVPVFSVVLRKGYGLGAMGLGGAVRLGYRKELEASPEGAQRDALFQQLLARQHDNGSTIPMATTLEIDAVINPADTRRWLSQGLAGAKPAALAADRFIDTW